MLLALLALVPSAFPCAGFFPTDSEAILATSDTQQAILARESDTQASATYRVTYAGNADDFAWVIPVPGPVVAVEQGDEALFEALDEITAPTWEREVPLSGDVEAENVGCGCGADSSLKAGSDSLGADRGDFSNGVDVVAQGYAGDFEYTVLQADQADGLVAWLTEHGYDTSVSAPAIARYVEDDTVAYRWVAVQLRPDLAQPDEEAVLPPLTVRWGADEGEDLVVRYPSRMASTSMLEEVRTTLWVQGMRMPELANDWTVATASTEDVVYDIRTTDTAADPAMLFADRLRETGGDARTYWRTWAGYPGDSMDFGGTGLTDPGYLVRFDGIHAPGSQLADATFEVGAEEVWDTTRILLPALPDADAETDGRSALALPLGVLAFALRRRFGGGQARA
jgi:hypothetical protein